MKSVVGIFLWVGTISSVLTGATTPLTTVRLGVVARWEPPPSYGDPVAFDRDEFPQAVYYALGENDARLAKCGYRVQPRFNYYERTNRLGPKDGAQQLENDGAWMIWGPSNSFDYLLAKKGLNHTPMVSPMAGANAVTNLPRPYFTMYPTIDVLARAAVLGAKDAKFGKRYGVFVDAGCPSCKDFAKEFEKQAAKEFEKAFWIDTAGESPELYPLRTEIASSRIHFLVLPNYGALSGHVIKGLQEKFPNLKYLGADAWGDEEISRLEQYALLPTVQGIAVRGGRAAKDMSLFYSVNSLHRQYKGQPVLPSYPHYMVVDFIRTLTNDLCEWKPKTKEEFRERLVTVPRDHFRSKAGVGVYHLNGGDLKISKIRVGLK